MPSAAESPDFSEIQLQTWMNSTMALYCHEQGHIAIPYSPDRTEERFLGFDEGFFVPWLLPNRGLRDMRGCNLFYQYKLSYRCKRGMKRFCHWNEPYFEFKIPHKPNKFHQWETLRELARRRCSVFYVTNATVDAAELVSSIGTEGRFLDEVKYLDVRDVPHRHQYVTFTRESDHFLLHSEPTPVRSLSIKQAVDETVENGFRPLGEDNFLLLGILKDFGGDSEYVRYHVNRYFEIDQSEDPLKGVRKFFLLRRAIQAVLNISVSRIVAVNY